MRIKVQFLIASKWGLEREMEALKEKLLGLSHLARITNVLRGGGSGGELIGEESVPGKNFSKSELTNLFLLYLH